MNPGTALAADPTLSPQPSAIAVEIVVPVYNEVAELGRSIERLYAYLSERFPLSWRVTIADNASTDGTWDVAVDLACRLRGVRAVHLDRKGRGRALREVWSASTAAVVAYMDVDLSTDLDALLPLVAPLLSGHSDLAIGTRLGRGARVVRGPKREMISRTYNLLLRTTMRSGFSDAQCGFKAVRSDVARELLPMVEDQEWFFDTELLLLAEHNGLRIHEVPVDWIDDADSRVEVAGTAAADLRGMWRVARTFAAGRGSLARARTAVLRPEDATTFDDALSAQLVRFASIGVVSTIVFGLLFVALWTPLGRYGADVVALTVCSLANTAANRRLTFALRGRARRARHYFGGLALGALPLVLTLLTLAAIGSTSLSAALVWLTVVNAVATLARFLLLRSWVFPRIVITWVRSRLARLLRYGAVSVVSSTLSLVVLGALVSTRALAPGWANVVATAAGTFPSFELNRRWVWGRTGRRSVVAEVGPFCAMTFAGLALSTVAVACAGAFAASSGFSGGVRTGVIELANVAAWGSIWLAQFVVLDRVLFGARPAGTPGSVSPDSELHRSVSAP